MFRNWNWKRNVLGAILCAAMVFVAFDFARAQENSADGFQLRPGVVVDRARGQVYVMSPDGGLVAVDLGGGKEVWRTREAAKPLALAGKLLIGQAEPTKAKSELQIVMVDAEKGDRRLSALKELPAGVTASIDNTPQNTFAATVRQIAGVTEILWENKARPLSGVPPGTLSSSGDAGKKGPPLGAAGAIPTPFKGAVEGLKTTTGSFQLNLPPEAFDSREVLIAPAAPVSATVESSSAEILKNVPEPKFGSADGRHLMNSQRVANDPVMDKYQWTIYESSSGKRVGQIRTTARVAPFFVVDGKIVYETGPYARRSGRELVEEPLQIRAVDLRTGAVLWKQQVRDTEPRGPLPP